MSFIKRLLNKSEPDEFFSLPSGFIKETLVCSHDGTRVACAVNDGQGQHVEVNGRPEATYHAVSGITFSPDSRQVAYAARLGNAWYAIFNGRRHGPFSDVGRTSPVISPASNQIAYTALTGQAWYAFIDDEIVGGPYEGFGSGGIVFSPDSRHIAYIVRRRATWLAVVDGGEHESFPSIIQRSHSFSPDSAVVVYVAVLDKPIGAGIGEAAVVVNGSPLRGWKFSEATSSDYGLMPEVYFSPDSIHMAYSVVQDGKCFVVVDGNPQQKCDGLVSGQQPKKSSGLGLESEKASWKSGAIAFSPDSQHCAYAMFDRRRQKHVLVFDGDEMAIHDSIANNRVVFSPDSNRLAYCAAEGGSQFLVLDFTPLRGFYGTANVAPSFSQDSHHIAYLAMDNPFSHTLAIDSQSWNLKGLTPYGAFLTWRQDNVAQILVVDGRRVTLVRQETQA
jgi:hypothetical protein